MTVLTLDRVGLPGRLAPCCGQVAAGKIVHLIGPNGAGKSTLLACLSGLLSCAGEITFLHKPLRLWRLAELACYRGFLHQNPSMPRQMTIFHYLQLWLRQADRPVDGPLAHILHHLQLIDKLSRNINQLSGGEWQRVRLAAILLQTSPQLNSRSRLLLLDEPMSGLDVAQQMEVDRLLLELCRQGVSIVMIGHDLNHTLHHADEVWLMHQGCVVAQGEVVEVMQPALLEQVWQVPFRKVDTEYGEMLTTRFLS